MIIEKTNFLLLSVHFLVFEQIYNKTKVNAMNGLRLKI